MASILICQVYYYLNLGGLEKVVLPEELEYHLKDGWMRGRRKIFGPISFPLAERRKFRESRVVTTPQKRSRRKPKSEWKRKLPDWPIDEQLLRVVSEIGERAFARNIGCSHVAVNFRVKKIKATQSLVETPPLVGQASDF